MLLLNPRYGAIFNPDNIDLKAAGKREQCQVLLEHCRAGAGSTKGQCDRIASLMNVEADFIKEALDAELYKQAVTMYLQLLKSMWKHFVEDEHYCYFDDMYSPEYTMQWIYESIRKAAIK